MSELLVGQTDRVWMEEERDGEEGWETEMYSGSPGAVGIYINTQFCSSGRRKYRRRGEQRCLRKKRIVNGQTGGRTDGQIKGRTDGQKDGQTDRAYL